MPRVPLVVLAVGLALSSTPAISADRLAPGTLVRVTAPREARRAVVGVFVEANEREIVVSRGGQNKTISLDAVTRLEWSGGRRTRARAGAKWGAAILGGLGATFAAVAAPPPTGTRGLPVASRCSGSAVCALKWGVPAAAAGAVIGALDGRVAGSHDWRDAHAHSVDVSPGPAPGGGVEVALHVSW